MARLCGNLLVSSLSLAEDNGKPTLQDEFLNKCKTTLFPFGTIVLAFGMDGVTFLWL
ncbi:MAG: hypothetical protein IKZ92_00140 [Muribaculaceae bacterium]|nr:hypothetical protein [Muribaculaceae bacterium]